MKFGFSHLIYIFLLATKTKLSEATTTIKKSEMDLKYTQKMLKEKENTRTTADASYQKSKQNLTNKEREVAGIKVRRYCIVQGLK